MRLATILARLQVLNSSNRPSQAVPTTALTISRRLLLSVGELIPSRWCQTAWGQWISHGCISETVSTSVLVDGFDKEETPVQSRDLPIDSTRHGGFPWKCATAIGFRKAQRCSGWDNLSPRGAKPGRWALQSLNALNGSCMNTCWRLNASASAPSWRAMT